MSTTWNRNIKPYSLKVTRWCISGPAKLSINPVAIVVQYDGPHLDIPRKTQLVRVKEITFTTYLFPNESDTRGGFYAVSIPNDDQNVEGFESFFNKEVEIADFYMLNPDL